MKLGRNDPCHCGSGRKYKQCHGKDGAGGRRDWTKPALLVLAAASIVGIGEFVLALGRAGDDGRIWSAEHGHWHDAEGNELAKPAPTFVPQPPGPVPEGKVWSTEHGHWHDAETGAE